MATALATPFYLDMGFSPETIGLVAKGRFFGYITAGVIGPLWSPPSVSIDRCGYSAWCKWSLFSALFGFLFVGNDPWILGAVIAGEYVGVGMGTSASVAFIARETSRLAVATQFALFTALASLPRVVSSSFSGMIVDSIGWTSFFTSALGSQFRDCCYCSGLRRLTPSTNLKTSFASDGL